MLLDTTERRAAEGLVAPLAALGWTPAIAEKPAAVPETAAAGTPVVVVADREDLDEPDWLVPLTERHPVLWAGETTDGTHVGPLLNSPDDVRRYFEATTTWWSDRAVRELGFTSRPLPLMTGPVRATAVASAVDSLLKRPESDRVFLLDGDRTARLWTAARHEPVPVDHLRGEQSWAKGLIRDLRVFDADSPRRRVRLATCRTLAGGVVAELESASGKGVDDEEAVTRAVGEAIERFAAWSANDLPRAPADGTRRRRLQDFHPYGGPYEAHLVDGSPPPDYVRGLSLVDGGPVDVPLALVAFPHIPGSNDRPRPTLGTTTGLAVHPERDEAVARALREVLERASLYPNFLWQRPAIRLPCTDPATRLLVYPDTSVPVVHAFIIADDRSVSMASRGSGSGLTWDQAAAAAVEEAEQIMSQMRREPPEHMGVAFREWADPTVVERVRAYVDAHPERVPPDIEHESVSAQIRAVVARSAEIVVVELPCPVRGWTAVRVLVPGTTVHRFTSRSVAGRQLAGAPWSAGLPGG
ncbi:YcaO-like family protein [Lentzea cavernae]|uniref:YcaO-like family protein n=1 Tax=Lentzea cavernae TaxID=2020703 RepID=UPI00174BEE7D|nr:YcaO-like family protein [Lentzea cavernae]